MKSPFSGLFSCYNKGMNKLVKRGFSAYKVFLKDKLAMALMMFIPGVMMFLGALNGKGNDTVAMPLGITAAGSVFTFWACYQVGRIKTELDHLDDKTDRHSYLIGREPFYKKFHSVTSPSTARFAFFSIRRSTE